MPGVRPWLDQQRLRNMQQRTVHLSAKIIQKGISLDVQGRQTENEDRVRPQGTTSKDTADDRQLQKSASSYRATRPDKHRAVQGEIPELKLFRLRLVGNIKVVWDPWLIDDLSQSRGPDWNLLPLVL